MKLTKKETRSLLLVSYNTLIEENKYNKQRMAGMLSEKIRVDSSPVALVVVAVSAAVAGTAAGAV